MTTAVLDASAVLALLLDERGANEVYALIADSVLLAVNYAEIISYFVKIGAKSAEIEAIVSQLPCVIVPADRSLSFRAGLLRGVTSKAGLSLGDRYCLALAIELGVPAVTADRSWKMLGPDVPVVVELIR
jgi:ribonuclease VapC